MDPVKGCAQTAATYWNACHAMYNLLRQQEGAPALITDWGVNLIKHRFYKTISPDYIKFVGYLQRTKAVEQSGWGIDDYINAADLLWQEQYKKPFKHKECMAVLSALPKFSMDSPSPADVAVHDEVLVVSNPMMPVQGFNKPRPIGRTKAKKRKAENDSVANTTIETPPPGDRSRMVAALERKNELKEITHRHRSWQKLTSMWMKLGDNQKAKYYLNKIEGDEVQNSNSIPTTVVLDLSVSDDNHTGQSVTSGGDEVMTGKYDDDMNDDDDTEDAVNKITAL